MTKTPPFVGSREFYAGDGAETPTSPGLVEIEASGAEYILRWLDAETFDSADIPIASLHRHHIRGATQLNS